MRAIVLAANGLNVIGLGPYGNEWVATPSLDRLAAESVTFDAHYAESLDAAAVRRAWRSGRFALPGGPLPAADPSAPDLIAALRGRGVRCVLIRESDAEDEFAAGWDEVHTLDPVNGESSRGALLAAAGEALDALSGRSEFLMWIESGRMLPPWFVPQDRYEAYFAPLPEDLDDEADAEGFELPPPCIDPFPDRFDRDDANAWEWLQCSFAAALTEFDDELGDLFEAFRARGRDKDALWALTAEAGYPLGEHGYVGDFRPWLYGEAVHVPLILRLPGGAEAGRRVPHLTQAADLPATLAEAFGVGLDFPHGRGLMAAARGSREPVRPYAVSGCEDGEAAEWSLRTAEWSFLLPLRPHPDDGPRGPMLFARPEDRFEANDVGQHHLDLCEGLEATLKAYATAAVKPGPLVDWPALPEEEVEPEE